MIFAKFILSAVALVGFVTAQIPVFPDNLVIFPERGFVSGRCGKTSKNRYFSTLLKNNFYVVGIGSFSTRFNSHVVSYLLKNFIDSNCH